MGPIFPAIFAAVVYLAVQRYWPRHQTHQFAYDLLVALRQPLLSIILIAGSVYALAGVFTFGFNFFLSGTRGLKFETLQFLEGELRWLSDTVSAWLPSPFIMAILALAGLLISANSQFIDRYAQFYKIVAYLIGRIGIVLAALATMTFLPGSIDGVPEEIRLELADAEGAMSAIAAESEEIAAREVLDGLYDTLIAQVPDADQSALSAAMEEYARELNTITALASRNNDSRLDTLRDLRSTIASDWQPEGLVERSLKALSDRSAKLGAVAESGIKSEPTSKIKSAAEILRQANTPSGLPAADKSGQLSQLRQSFITNSYRVVVDKLGAAALRSAITNSPLAHQFLETLTDALIETAHEKYRARQVSLVEQALAGQTPDKTKISFSLKDLNIIGNIDLNNLRSKFEVQLYKLENTRYDCRCTGRINWALSNVTLSQCYSRPCL